MIGESEDSGKKVKNRKGRGIKDIAGVLNQLTVIDEYTRHGSILATQNGALSQMRAPQLTG